MRCLVQSVVDCEDAGDLWRRSAGFIEGTCRHNSVRGATVVIGPFAQQLHLLLTETATGRGDLIFMPRKNWCWNMRVTFTDTKEKILKQAAHD